MKNEHSLICQKLNDIKTEHNLTNVQWAELSGVPVGTISRYLSYNVGVPNFPYICAMLGAVGINPSDFYSSIMDGGVLPGETMVAASAGALEAELDPHQDEMLIESMRERVAQQADRINELDEIIRAYQAQTHEQDAQLRELHAELRAAEHLIEERDHSISRRDDIIARNDLLIAHKNKIILIIGALLCAFMLADLLIANIGWLRFSPT